jgi:hypothetical protein
MRHFAFSFVLTLLTCLPLTTQSHADERKPEPANDAEAKAALLVRQLGSDSFDLREAAYAELEKLGKSAIKALEEGAKSRDPEISGRAKRLLALATRTDIEVALDAFLADKDTKHLLKLPAWDRFKKLFGEDANARALFVEMYVTEGRLLAALEREPEKFDATLNARCKQFQQPQDKHARDDDVATMGRVVAILFAATDGRAAKKPDRVEPWHYTLTEMVYRQNVQKEFRSSAAARKLLALYFEQRAEHPNYMLDGVNLALALEMKEMVPTVRKGATNKDIGDGVRATAMLALARLGSKENVKDLEPFLADTARLSFVQFDGTGEKPGFTEVRDVALAAMIILSGQDVRDYDFPRVKESNYTEYQARQLGFPYWGFSNDEQRKAALKKFKDSQEKEKK